MKKITLKKAISKAVANEINAWLDKLKPEQIEFFHRLYPEGVENLSGDRLRHAIGIIDRTYIKNKNSEK